MYLEYEVQKGNNALSFGYSSLAGLELLFPRRYVPVVFLLMVCIGFGLCAIHSKHVCILFFAVDLF